jgi:hypothetical protein
MTVEWCPARMEYRFVVPLRTGRGLNDRKHWGAKAKRVEVERSAIALAFPWWARRVPLPVDVILTRISPGSRPMDDDNLAGSMKAVRDEVSRILGVDDGRRELIRFTYEQNRGPCGVAVTIRRRQ